MEKLSTIAAGGFDLNSMINICSKAKELIEKFDAELNQRKSADKYQSLYAGVGDILLTKYHKDPDQAKSPDFETKTEFISDNVRGNFQKANGNVLSYDEANMIVSLAKNGELP